MGTNAYREEMKMKVTFGAWGFVIGAVVTMIIGFNWGGWTTSGTTQKMTQEAVSDSQVASQAAICIDQFINDHDYEDNIVRIQKTDFHTREIFIEKGGWDLMPGQKETTSGVAGACGKGLLALIHK